jgi:hypothetical protein
MIQRPAWCREGHSLLAASLIVISLVGCAGASPRPVSDSAEALFPTTEELARAAVVKVLAENGYGVTVDEAARLIRTDYRQETDGPWDRLLVYRFGTIRSWVEATIVPESDSIRVKIDVFVEGKDRLLGSWQPFEAPLPQRAATHLWQVQKTLALL